MKLKELFEKYTFDEILPYLKTIDPEKEDSMYQFREAFDLLLRTDASTGECGKVQIEWSDDEEESDRFITVNHLAGDYWENGLAKEIVISDDICLNEKEISAHCLWEITFYDMGNKPDEYEDKVFEIPPKPKNKYEEALYKLRLSNWKHSTPRKYRSNSMPLCTDVEYCMKRVWVRKNRSKRKRDYRIKCREKYLEKHGQRERFIMKLTSCGAFRRDEVEYLHQVSSGQYYPYVSRTWDGNNRIGYILESINKYQNIDHSQFNDAIICILASSKRPFLEVERMKLLDGLPASLTALTLKVGIGTREDMEHEVEMLLFLNTL